MWFRRDGPAARVRLGQAPPLRPGPRDGRVARDRKAERTLRGLSDPDPRPDGDRRARTDPRPHLEPRPGDDVGPVVVDRDPERAAEPARTRGHSGGCVRDPTGPQQHRLPPAGDEIGADDLMDPEHVERSRADEHRVVPPGLAPERVARGVPAEIRLGLDELDLPREGARTDPQPAPEEIPGDADGRPVEERTREPAGSVAGRERGQSSFPRSASGWPSTVTVASPTVIHER